MRLLDELKRRRVIKSGLAYLAAAVVFGEGVSIFAPAVGIPDPGVRWMLYVVIVGFPLFLLLAWRYDIDTSGLRVTPGLTEDANAGTRQLAPADEPSTGDEPESTPTVRPPPRDRARRQVTVLALQAPAYFHVSERLDPEDAHEFTDRVAEVAEDVAQRLGGRVDRFSGEELVVVFGDHGAHEDDPLRGVRAALSLRDGIMRVCQQMDLPTVSSLDEGYAVATGVALVERGDDRGGTRVTGDPLLVATHLAAHANPGSVLVDSLTFRHTEGLLRYEALPHLLLEGRRDPIDLYRLVAPKAVPTTVHDPGGLKTEMVGRSAELQALFDALAAVRAGSPRVVVLEGEAGTGKSRLVEEFRRGLDEDVAWLEGHAFPYAQSSPYFPVTDLLSRQLGISDEDSQADVRKKIRRALDRVGGDIGELEVWIGSLYELQYPELANLQPDAWKPRLQDAVYRLLSRVALQGPTVIVFEDLHWADSSTADLLHHVIARLRQPILLLLTHRPGFKLHRQAPSTPHADFTIQSVSLSDLSTSESSRLVRSLLDSDDLPPGLVDFVLQRADGNPLYVEEIVKTMVESGTLLRRGGIWRLTRPLDGVSFSQTVQGLIVSRVDRLEAAIRRTLQEASVIGRTFDEVVLRAITFEEEGLRGRLDDLVELGMIHLKGSPDTARFVFNHALTQQVVYDSLLKADRRQIHERIGNAMEGLYRGREVEFCEALAFHYRRGTSEAKAVEYLTIAGDKAWRRYALDVADQYFREAFDTLADDRQPTESETASLLSILNKWAIVYNHLGDYRTLAALLEAHEGLARSVAHRYRAQAALFYGWLGYALQCRERLGESYGFLEDALEEATAGDDSAAIAYVSAWMARTCVDMGRLDEALEHGARAERIARELPADAKLFRFIYSALGLAYYFRGDRAELDDVADRFLEYGEEHTDLRSLVLGHVNRGCSYLVAGDFTAARGAYERGINVSVDPMYSMYARLMLGVTHASAGDMDLAEATLTEVIEFDEEFGFDLLGTTAQGMLSIVLLSRGELTEGVRLAETVIDSYRTKGNRYRHALQEYMLGRVYLRIALGEGEGGLVFMARNAAFLLRNVPQARSKAREHLTASVQIAREIGAKGVLGQTLISLGRFLDAVGEVSASREAVREALSVLDQCKATEYLKEARRVQRALAPSR